MANDKEDFSFAKEMPSLQQSDSEPVNNLHSCITLIGFVNVLLVYHAINLKHFISVL